MDSWIQVAVTIFCSIAASSGFWAYILKKHDKKDAKTKMLIGLAHDRIVHLGMSYINRGYITPEEYKNLIDYLYSPYKEMGGNGSAEKIIEEVKKLKIERGKNE